VFTEENATVLAGRRVKVEEKGKVERVGEVGKK
jgi:hypothetical protein